MIFWIFTWRQMFVSLMHLITEDKDSTFPNFIFQNLIFYRIFQVFLLKAFSFKQRYHSTSEDIFVTFADFCSIFSYMNELSHVSCVLLPEANSYSWFWLIPSVRFLQSNRIHFCISHICLGLLTGRSDSKKKVNARNV